MAGIATGQPKYTGRGSWPESLLESWPESWLESWPESGQEKSEDKVVKFSLAQESASSPWLTQSPSTAWSLLLGEHVLLDLLSFVFSKHQDSQCRLQGDR